jgi:hypothetical protein
MALALGYLNIAILLNTIDKAVPLVNAAAPGLFRFEYTGKDTRRRLPGPPDPAKVSVDVLRELVHCLFTDSIFSFMRQLATGWPTRRIALP